MEYTTVIGRIYLFHSPEGFLEVESARFNILNIMEIFHFSKMVTC